MVTSFLAVVFGGALGCVSRWILGNALNLLSPAIPPGILVPNLIGAHLVGISLAFFGAHPDLPPQWRLLVITGFLGGLTTFSRFSEGVLLMRQDRMAMACASMALHLGGSLLLPFAGKATASLLRTR